MNMAYCSGILCWTNIVIIVHFVVNVAGNAMQLCSTGNASMCTLKHMTVYIMQISQPRALWRFLQHVVPMALT